MAIPINFSKLSKKQLKRIIDGTKEYLNIQYSPDPFSPQWNEQFRKFYLEQKQLFRAGSVRQQNLKIFINLMKKKPWNDPIDFANALHKKGLFKTDGKISKDYEMSFATKVVHYYNINSPIYDRFVREYLEQIEGINGLTKGTGKDKAIQKWSLIQGWYIKFVSTDKRYKTWITWFDKNLGFAKHISPIKKIDSIIFALSRP